MKKFNLLIALIAIALLNIACSREKQDSLNDEINKKLDEKVLTVDELLANADKFSEKIVEVYGIIDHICEHSFKRFKIVTKENGQELKVELGDSFKELNLNLMGKTVKVKGNLVPTKMNAEDVESWHKKMKNSHKGEENTEHYKQEDARISSIYNKIVSGEIPYYTMYVINATEVDFDYKK